MIAPTVNGDVRSIGAPPDMPLPWIPHAIGLPNGTKRGCGAAPPGGCTAQFDGAPSSFCQRHSETVGKLLNTTAEVIGGRAAAGTTREAWFALEAILSGTCHIGRTRFATALPAVDPDDYDVTMAAPDIQSLDASLPTRTADAPFDYGWDGRRCTSFGCNTPTSCKTPMAPWRARIAARLIDEQLASPLQLGTLAAAVRLSTSQFLKTFKTSFGVTPHQWLIRRRLAHSLQFLAVTELPLAEVALECGFADQSHFTRTFSRVIGVPPGVWRRASRSRPQIGGPVIPDWNRPYLIGGLLQSNA